MKLFIAIPVYQPTTSQFLSCMLNLFRNSDNLIVSMQAGDGLVGRSRNFLSDAFLKSDCDKILFIDNDILFSHEDVGRISSHNELIVGGFYPRKTTGDPSWVANGFVEGTAQPDERGLTKVMYMGTGFLCVKREVFDLMRTRWPEEEYTVDGPGKGLHHNYWPVGVCQARGGEPGQRRYLSEDWYFCERALQLGLNVWGDTRCTLRHIGLAIYPIGV